VCDSAQRQLEPGANGSMISRMYAFSKSAGKWLRQSKRRKPAPVDLPALSVCTFNVWFDPYESARRSAALLDILAGTRADVIALQEVTPRFLSALLGESWVRAAYSVSRSKLVDARYDVVMLSKLPVRHFVPHQITSDMGRRLHALTVPTTRGNLVIAGVHMESMRERTPTRLKQIAECTPILSRADTAIWLGDFNAAPRSEEDEAIRCAFRDIWDELHKAPGYTRDTTANAMLAKVKADRHQRIDRVFLRGEGFQPLSVRLLGTAPLPGTDGQVFPSDHFGLMAEFEAAQLAVLANTGE
jgi:endonuclease/exonuclease/phosphatase family metal-dependent hydrolase